MLREAGILLGEPNAVDRLRDPRGAARHVRVRCAPSGFDAQLVVAEGYLKRPTDDMGNCIVTCGRIEQVLATAGYGAAARRRQARALGHRVRALSAVRTDDRTPSPWALGALARMRRFTYGEHGEPFGAFDLPASSRCRATASRWANSDKSLRIAGELGFTYVINQVSGVRLAAKVAEDAGALFIGADAAGDLRTSRRNGSRDSGVGTSWLNR